MVRYELNEECNRVEIYFDGVHDVETRDRMKATQFRWNHNKVCWYAKQNDETIALAKVECIDF